MELSGYTSEQLVTTKKSHLLFHYILLSDNGRRSMALFNLLQIFVYQVTINLKLQLPGVIVLVTEEEMFSLPLRSQRCYLCKHWKNITETLLKSAKSFLNNDSEMQGNIYISIHTFFDVFWKLYIHIKY